jgi:hypothetical protein
MKDLGNLNYFIGIEVVRTERGICLCQQKYTLDLLTDMGMMGCRAATTPIEQNHQVTIQSDELVNKKDYQKLVGRLLYLCHTRPKLCAYTSINPKERKNELQANVLIPVVFL